MISKTPKVHQMSIFEVALESFIDMNHELVLLSSQIDWPAVESEFAEYYCADNGRPSVPIRRMEGMMLLKSIYNLSDEGVVARWMENPYMQYFTGEKVFQKCPPMNPADLTKFRSRIGTGGVEKIFKLSLIVNAEEITKKEMRLVMIDSTVQEKNITFPTDAKLYRKIIEKVLKMAEREGIVLRRTYTREVKTLKLKVRFMNHPPRMKEGKKAVKRLRTIARAMVSDIARKMDEHQMPYYRKDIEIFRRVINQERSDKDKVYSLHEPQVECISKGKEHKKYEFGNKSGIAKTGSGLIVSAIAVISIPTSGTPGQSYYQKQKARKKFCKRAGIEPVIGHPPFSSFVSWLKALVEYLENVLLGTENKNACLGAPLAIVA